MAPLLLLAFALYAQDKCELSGTVVNSVTTEPLNKVELVLEEVDRATHAAAVTTTDSQGRFSMIDLDPGAYHLTGKRPGYLETAYGARRAEGMGAVLRLETGRCLGDLKLKLVPYGVIAGAIRDSDGEPLAGATVTAARLTYESGKPHLESVNSVETDDLGQYRIRDLAPGKYYVGVTPLSDTEAKVDHSAGRAQPEAGVPTVWPGSADLSLAAPVEVATGARINGIDITIARARTYTVMGRVVTAAGAGVGGASITLRKRPNGLDIDRNLHTNTRSANGDFELRGVQAGPYLLLVTRNESQVATMPLEITGDIDGLAAVLGSGARVRARVVSEDNRKIQLTRFSIFITPDGVRGYFLTPEDGGAAENNVAPDRYEVRLMSPPPGLYIKSIRSGETDVLADGLSVAQGASVEFEIILAADSGKVEGAALDANGQPVSGATVLLAPEPRPRVRADQYKTATTDQYGKFEFPAVAPGAYKVFAWDDVEPGIWNDPDFLKACDKKGEPVTVHPNGREVVKVSM